MAWPVVCCARGNGAAGAILARKLHAVGNRFDCASAGSQLSGGGSVLLAPFQIRSRLGGGAAGDARRELERPGFARTGNPLQGAGPLRKIVQL
ncbi:unnamed protein product [Amoebophrya sp. A120]|nr:unnamed protein product [Amoebophrya sp. A120]|eukprot:GSA120T00008275001.1